jgi:hypothetical protein
MIYRYRTTTYSPIRYPPTRKSGYPFLLNHLVRATDQAHVVFRHHATLYTLHSTLYESLSLHGKFSSAEFLRDRLRRHYVNPHAKQLQQFMPDRPDVEHRHVRSRVNQEVKIAFPGVIAASDRAEDAGIACPMRSDHAPNGITMGSQGERRFHAFSLECGFSRTLTSRHGSARPTST